MHPKDLDQVSVVTLTKKISERKGIGEERDVQRSSILRGVLIETIAMWIVTPDSICCLNASIVLSNSRIFSLLLTSTIRPGRCYSENEWRLTRQAHLESTGWRNETRRDSTRQSVSGVQRQASEFWPFCLEAFRYPGQSQMRPP